MGLVAALAWIFGIIGLLTLVVGLTFASWLGQMLEQAFRFPQTAPMVAAAVAPFALAALGPFVIWGILYSLVRLHDRLESIETLLQRPGRGVGQAPDVPVLNTQRFMATPQNVQASVPDQGSYYAGAPRTRGDATSAPITPVVSDVQPVMVEPPVAPVSGPAVAAAQGPSLQWMPRRMLVESATELLEHPDDPSRRLARVYPGDAVTGLSEHGPYISVVLEVGSQKGLTGYVDRTKLREAPS